MSDVAELQADGAARPATLGELKASGYRSRTLREEMREYLKTCGLTPEQADLVLIHRRDYLVHTFLRGHGPLHSPSF